MNKVLKRLLLGLIIWAVPFVVSVVIWDMQTNAPRVSMPWFSALMAFFWAVGFAIAACMYFKPVSKSNAVAEGWITGITWYIELLVLDLIVLVGLFKMAIPDFYPMLVTYLNAVAISSAIGYIKKA